MQCSPFGCPHGVVVKNRQNLSISLQLPSFGPLEETQICSTSVPLKSPKSQGWKSKPKVFLMVTRLHNIHRPPTSQLDNCFRLVSLGLQLNWNQHVICSGVAYTFYMINALTQVIVGKKTCVLLYMWTKFSTMTKICLSSVFQMLSFSAEGSSIFFLLSFSVSFPILFLFFL